MPNHPRALTIENYVCRVGFNITIDAWIIDIRHRNDLGYSHVCFVERMADADPIYAIINEIIHLNSAARALGVAEDTGAEIAAKIKAKLNQGA